ncbi:MAG: transglutaminase family protein, partial [Fibrobacteria bacterium]
MSIRVSLRHISSYKYDRPVTLSPQLIRLRPAAHCRTRIDAYSLKVKPSGHFLNWQQDPFGNFMARVVFPEPQREFEVEVGLVADMTTINPFDFFVEPEADKFPFTYSPSLRESLAPYLEIREDGDLLKEWLKGVDRKPRSIVDFLMDLNQRIPKEVKYCIRLESGVQSSEETLKLLSGSCRDSAWLLVMALRHLGIAARFASGYLIQLQPDKTPVEGPAGPTSDFTDLHAWAEAYVPGAGWIGLDSTSGLMAGEGHIPLSCTPSPEDAAPISGGVSACESTFNHIMDLARLLEAPRVTAPITDEEWLELLALGDRVDKDMVAAGMELTQGGEPTFVSVDDMDGAEWNTAALGDKKYALANDLTWRLQARFAPGAMLHYGQGKWYPGEPLPRWALTVMWRPDGKPVWRNPKLQAREGALGKYTSKDADALVRSIAKFLVVDPGLIKPAYEDAFYYLWKEGRLPADFDPKRTDWKSDAERARILRLLESGLDKVAGYVLPLAGNFDGVTTRWRSDLWTFRRAQLFLLPGDSPLGYRLPLDSIPWGPSAPEFPAQLSPLAERPPLPNFHFPSDKPPAEARASVAGTVSPQKNIDAWMPRRQVAAPMPVGAPTVRTALSVEARGGYLYVFMPPVTNLESFLELVSVLEAAAEETGLALRIEGYRPPQDYRLKSFAITPDPGVIEVNIHPSASWQELVEKTEIIYEEAGRCRLGAEKFQLDGRHTGTGGGNHIVLGAERPADSPFLRRPHLLRSVINFWQNHPSLSYLFSGLFIGPTSQSPRLDEARDDALSELQLAFKQVPNYDSIMYWQVDRIFRNLLVDLTGNTHRAELCIDKMYSPDSLSGRLGLLELRGFEMPPHPRLNIAQCLLVRALITRFWDHPYSAPLQPWGMSLHDRWMLPHFLWSDLEDVLGFLDQGGYHLKPEWYAPFLEFRFPVCGGIQLKNFSLEVRQAAEPWHVLGEEASGSGTSRYVDSSLERLQVKVNGFDSKRHAVAVNGIAMPLTLTGVAHEAVAGVRFRAWQP